MGRREVVEDDIVLGILGAVEQDSSVTQRRVASELGIALGLANSYLKRCVKKGFVKVRQAPTRRYAYYLTPKGFAEKSRLTSSYLSRSFSFFRSARMQCDELLAGMASGGARSVLLFGDGDLADIVSLLSGRHDIEVCGVVKEVGDVSKMVRSRATADHYMITSLEKPRELYIEAVRVFGSASVSAPALLLHLATPHSISDAD